MNKDDIRKNVLLFAGGLTIGFTISTVIKSDAFKELKSNIIENLKEGYNNTDQVLDINYEKDSELDIEENNSDIIDDKETETSDN